MGIGAFIMMTTFFLFGFFIDDSETLAYISMVPLGLFVILANLGLMPIPFILPALLLENPEHRTVITGTMVLVGLIVLFPLSLLLPYLLYQIDNFTFLIFSVCIFFSVIYGYFKMP